MKSIILHCSDILTQQEAYSYAGHMWFTLVSDTESKSYGYGPHKKESNLKAQLIVNYDDQNYIKRWNSNNIIISQNEYEKIKQFIDHVRSNITNKSGEFSSYNVATCNCVSFTWGALRYAGIVTVQDTHPLSMQHERVSLVSHLDAINSNMLQKYAPPGETVDVSKIKREMPILSNGLGNIIERGLDKIFQTDYIQQKLPVNQQFSKAILELSDARITCAAYREMLNSADYALMNNAMRKQSAYVHDIRDWTSWGSKGFLYWQPVLMKTLKTRNPPPPSFDNYPEFRNTYSKESMRKNLALESILRDNTLDIVKSQKILEINKRHVQSLNDQYTQMIPQKNNMRHYHMNQYSNRNTGNISIRR
jgi:hypothetical protein